MAAEPLLWSLSIPSDLRLLAQARSFITGVCQAAALNEQVSNAVVMATDEATNNIIRHAHQDCPDAPVRIECLLYPDRLEVRLLDEGAPFDLDAVPYLDPGELRPGGRGVFLMRTLMDELSCEPRAPRGNILRMVKYLGGAPARPSG
jgi:anti-sigma regulatory factor (Ser/Thr protein kinase)